MFLVAVLVCIASTAVAAVAPAAQDEPARGAGQPFFPTPQMIEEAGQAKVGQTPSVEIDTEAAHELPHSGLDTDQALNLLTSVFPEATEAPAGFFDEVPEGKFIGTNAEVITSESAAELAGEAGGAGSSSRGAGPALIESATPLRVEDEHGQLKPVDLSLEHTEGELQPENPIVPVAIPAKIGDGVELGEGGLEISFPGAASDRQATVVEGDAAFYANVQEDTDLLVAPTPTGIETMTQIRSAAASPTQVVTLSLPGDASLVANEAGGAEVKREGKQLMEVLPATAVDATGESVPTTMAVSGDQLHITVEPSGDVVYPILVDPNYRIDEYNWVWGGSTFTGWQATTSAPGYKALPYSQGFNALGLYSWSYWGGATPNTGAQWYYLVPRWYTDPSTPTSWIEWVTIGGMMYLQDSPVTEWPEIISGLIDPIHGGWVGVPYSWNGAYGEFAGWSGNFHREAGANHFAKEFVFGLITIENEALAKSREAEAATATIELRDEDTPIMKSAALASPPTTWVNEGEYTLAYEAEDTGLGVNGLNVEVEGQPSTAHNIGLACTGTNQSPCPRVAKSGVSGSPVVKLNAKEAPTGRDWFRVRAYDALNAIAYEGADPVPHIGPGIYAHERIELKVDHTPPKIDLSGPLTEQETLGTTQSEYPLNISVTDGEDGAPQSGIAGVEVKVDGKNVTMPNETPWHPNCATQNCYFNGIWTLKASEYALGTHEVEVVARDAVGLETHEIQEVELGQEPLQTSFTSPHPSFAAHEIPTMTFKGTREGKPVEGVTYKCSLDEGPTPTKPCSSPYGIGHLESGKWHTLRVAAVDKSGIADPTPATWNFETGAYPTVPATSPEKLVYPEVGKKTASYYTLEAEWGPTTEGEAVTGVSFEVRLPPSPTVKEPVFEPVPTGCVIDGHGKPVSWPLRPRSYPGHTQPVYLKVLGCPMFEKAGYPEKEIQFRAVFDGDEKAAGASAPAATEFVRVHNGTRVPTDATESVGPASVDLLTGAFSLSRTDVSIPVPGYEANLEFTRTYNSSQDTSLPGYSKVLGGAWQPSSPLEAEFEGEAWTRIELKVIPEHPKVMGYACWNPEEEPVECHIAEMGCPKTSCEEWEEEPFQPREEWIELFDNEGNGIPFEIKGDNYVAPEYARELKLTKEGASFILGYPNGTQINFVQDGENAPDWLPKTISYQANADSMRLVFAKEGKSQRLVEEIAPAAVPCGEAASIGTPGCRTLIFNYSASPLGGQLLSSISYYGPNGSGVSEEVAHYTYAEVTGPEGAAMALSSEREPRVGLAAEIYSYAKSPHGDLLAGVTPPGQEAWSFGYEYGSGSTPSKLKTATRAGATTTIAYGVPVSGSGAPYAMSPESIAAWGQTDFPVDATAVFPPIHVPSEYPPHEYTGATVHYMDPNGYQVNVASPSPPGVTGASIATTETDVHGDVVRELDPQNRLYALEASNTVARSHELDTHSIYNAAGTEQLESWGPLHQVRLKSGEKVEARQHTVTRYDEGESTPPAGTPWAFLPTKETVGVVVPGKEGELEAWTTETRYDWGIRKPAETIVDPGGLNIRSKTVYNHGLVVATSRPKDVKAQEEGKGEGAGTTKTIYYSPGTGAQCLSNQYAYLPCQIRSAAQAEGTGRPKLLLKNFTAYDNLDEPEVIKESAGGEGEERVTTVTYNNAGRQVATKITGGGAEVPKMETEYSPTLGLATGQHFACGKECAAASYSSYFGALGTATGKFNRPADVTVDPKGNLWVADMNNNRLQEFTAGGGFLKSVGAAGTGNGQFKRPKSVAFTTGGNFWVADSGNNRLEEFSEAGAFLKAVGSLGTGNGQFSGPEHLAIDSKGNIWVSDTHNSRIQELNENGEFVKVVNPSGLGAIEPTGIAVGPEGNLWVTDHAHDRVVEISGSSETLIRQFGSEGTGRGKFMAPDALTVDPAGHVWVVDGANDRVEEFSQEGRYIAQFGAAGEAIGQFYFAIPNGIAIDSKGNIWVTNSGNNRIDKWVVAPNVFDDQATTTEYNKLGQITAYEDADGNRTETTYDAVGRPLTTTDGRGSKTVTYDPVSGLPTALEVSGIGTFTARYDADSDMVETTMPNGLSRKTTYDAVGQPVALAYTKASSCGSSCIWYEESLERGADGKILSDTNSLVSDLYKYDGGGRLEESIEAPVKGTCTTTRRYSYDADSNRLSKTTTNAGEKCSTAGEVTQSYSYDAADRLAGSGIVYDNWGRITSLPGVYAGGSTLETKYFSTGMVATQGQAGVTNAFQLDSVGRQRQREQTGGVAGIEVFHYDSGSDSPSWTALGSTWSRSVAGMGGELAAVQQSSGTITFKLTSLHGDVVASASASPTATSLLATYRYSEFGEPTSGSVERFAWLGGKLRRSELPSGAIQMGARNYIPQLGRFLTPDPVKGGSANAYDYAGQDPVNVFDLGGNQICEFIHGQKICGKTPNETSKKIAHAKVRYRRESARAARAAEAASRTAAASAHHHGAVFVASCRGCEGSPHKESFFGGIWNGVSSAAVSIGGDIDDVIPYRAAAEAFQRADAWNPERLIQVWQCSWAISAEDGSWKAQCDPIELILGAPPASAGGR